jgi:hypothetical protein
MRFQFTAAFLLLLNASSSSSFGTNTKRIHHGRHVPRNADRFPFMCSGGGMGGTVESKLSATVDSPAASTTDVSSSNLALLSDRGRTAILRLIENDVDGAQRHVYGDWPEAGIDDKGKVRLTEQVSGTVFAFLLLSPICLALLIAHVRTFDFDFS